MLDNCDKWLLTNTYLRQRNDCLKQSQILYLLTAIRHLNKEKRQCNYINLFLFLRLTNHTQSTTDINKHLAILEQSGYSTKHGQQVYITQAGKRALNEIDLYIEASLYRHRKTDPITRQLRPSKHFQI